MFNYKDESHTLLLSLPEGGSETLLRCTNKTDILSMKTLQQSFFVLKVSDKSLYYIDSYAPI